MSISGNNHSSGNSGSRTSIFEAFHTPSFGDDHFDVQPQPIVIQPIRTYTRQPVVAAHVPALTVNSQTGSSSSLQSLGQEDESRTMEQEIFDEDEESSGENAVTTLWMSCSPGRDSTDDEEEEEEEEVAPSQEDEEDDEGEGVGAESSDDGLPLAKLAGKRFLEKGLKPPNVKRNKPTKPLRLRKDKKGPKKPLSAYAFFYRDTQMAIKSQNPQATFGEISKIVASMWDRLDGELKEDYNKRAEENKKEYIKQLAEYCALNKDKISTSAKSKQKKAKKSSSKPKRKPLESDDPSESQFDRVVDNESDARDETDDNNMATSRRSSDSSERMMSPKQDEKQEKPRPICNYTKCQNPAIDDPRWETNYCSSECVILHCKDVFNAWVANRKTAYCET